MHPIYKFELTAGGTTQRCYPIYGSDLSKEFNKESGQEFFRAKLSGKLTFERDDYDFIVGKAIDTQFVLTMYVSTNAGSSWSSNWVGTFWKTDCEFDMDSETVVVQPEVSDVYKAILDGWDKEFNLIELAPACEQIKIDKRPMIQVYVPGQTVIGCFLAGMAWEQECDEVSNTSDLTGKYKFYLLKSNRCVEVSGTMSPTLPDIFSGATPNSETGTYSYTNSGYKVQVSYVSGLLTYSIIRTSDNTTLWQKQSSNVSPPAYPSEVVLSPVSGSGASGNVTLYIHDIAVYGRVVCDVESVDGSQTFPIPSDDLVANNRNYRRIIQYYAPESILFSTNLSTSPTQYGIYQPGKYYQPPTGYFGGQLFPVSKSAWGRTSIWFAFSHLWSYEDDATQPYVLRDAYPLASVISVLLGQIAPSISHAGTTTYSQFLYGVNPITGVTTTPVITPKSNLINSGYDRPAEKAPITLKYITEMLRDVFCCYWFVDSSNRFRIEHISYFRNGESYSGSPSVGADLTTMQVSRNGKKWAFGKDAYKFDKPEMTARYQFGWMDESTQLFDGYPIDIVSNYVQKDKIENIQVGQFTTNVDYILLNPSVISKDGFVLMLCQQTNYSGSSWINFLSTPMDVSLSASVTQHEVLDLSLYRGKTVRLSVAITGGASSEVYGWIEDGSYSAIELAGTVTTQQGVVTWEFVMPSAGSFLSLMAPSAATLTIYSGDYRDSDAPQALLGLPYVNITVQGNDHKLQNGYAAFAYLQQFYAYDMPAKNYTIDGVAKVAVGIKKLKTQEVNFPQITEPNLLQLIKTNLGNGKIRKMSLNLSSRTAKTTLEYDTE